MREMRRKPEVLEESPSGRMSRLPCNDYVEEFASIFSGKKGIFQNASFFRPRVVTDLGESVDMHTVRLMNNFLKKKMMTRVQWFTLKKNDMHGTEAYSNLLSTLTKVTKDRGDLRRIVLPISAGPTLQNLRIRVRKLRNGKSKVPSKQRGDSSITGKRICCRFRSLDAHVQQVCWKPWRQ